jgi:hypothetical protein
MKVRSLEGSAHTLHRDRGRENRENTRVTREKVPEAGWDRKAGHRDVSVTGLLPPLVIEVEDDVST